MRILAEAGVFHPPGERPMLIPQTRKTGNGLWQYSWFHSAARTLNTRSRSSSIAHNTASVGRSLRWQKSPIRKAAFSNPYKNCDLTIKEQIRQDSGLPTGPVANQRFVRFQKAMFVVGKGPAIFGRNKSQAVMFGTVFHVMSISTSALSNRFITGQRCSTLRRSSSTRWASSSVVRQIVILTAEK